ncbi:MAG: type I-C CRISPR-associated protein Cas7/Csd2 [Rikenellaceae bacterium]
MTTVNNKIDFVYIFDIQDGNPNGDPDAGNLPRVDPETGMGLVTDVCLKRKVRNYVQVAKGCSEGFDIFIKEKAVLDNLVIEIYKDITEKKNKAETDKEARERLCRKYYDIRTFGAVLATKDKQGQVRGAIQLTFSRSIEPIVTLEHSITRMASTKDDGTGKTMGRKSTVPYGLYVCHGFISANLAKDTGFSGEDLELFYSALANMFDCDRSAARGLMSAQKLILFTHDSELGNAPANKLFDLVKIEKNSAEVARSFADYTVTIDRDSLPSGVSVTEKF